MKKMSFFSIDNCTDFEYYLKFHEEEEDIRSNNSSVVSLKNQMGFKNRLLKNFIAVWITVWLQ